MQRSWVAWLLLVIALFLLLGCATEKPTKPSRAVKLIASERGEIGENARANRSAENLPVIDADSDTGNDADGVEGNATAGDGTNESGIMIRRLSDEEIAQLRRNTQEHEYLRDRRYSTTIDLTQVDGYNCRSVIEQLEKELERLARDVRELDNERRRKEQEANDAETSYREILPSGDEFRIKTSRFDWNDAEDEYDEAKKASKDMHDKYDQTERTSRIVELECPAMRQKAGLPSK